jgi:hypothetical protein
MEKKGTLVLRVYPEVPNIGLLFLFFDYVQGFLDLAFGLLLLAFQSPGLGNMEYFVFA